MTKIVFNFQLYLNTRLTCACGGLQVAKTMIQFTLVCIASFISLSRVSDYKHHWSDVMAGMFLGAISAFACFYCVTPIANPKWYCFRAPGSEHLSQRSIGESPSSNAP